MFEPSTLVLHVEDEPGMAELVRETLAEDGWHVQSAATGRLGLEALSTGAPQLLLLDYVLPDMLGTEFLDQLGDLGLKPPPFIVTTGLGSEQVAVQMMKRGAADYLVKDGRFLGQLGSAARRVWREAETAKRLAQTELQLSFLAQHSSDLLAITDQAGIPWCQTPAAERITGYSLADLHRPLLDLVHVDDREDAWAWWSEVTSSPRATAHASFRLQRRDGSLVWVEVVAQNHLGDPALHGVIINVRDITARVLAERERMEFERQLLRAQKLESLGVLAAGIAHDFNNLLAAIMGNLDLALCDLPTGTEARESVDLAVKASQRASDLTKQILSYSGHGTFACQPLDLSGLVRENSELFAVSVGRNIQLVTETDPHLPQLRGNQAQLQQVVMNLLTNASEAIGACAGTISLETSQCLLTDADLSRSVIAARPPPGRFVCLKVHDTGCGMSESVLSQLFDPFFSTKRTGRGLGMAAVRGIVQSHGGALFVESVEGAGTTVRVALPPDESLTVPQASATQPTATGVLGARVLVVDDDPAVRATALRILHRLGCEALEASDGREALELVAGAPRLDAILMDLTMPNLGGLEAMALLRKDPSCPPIILCSGYGEKVITTDASLAGAAAVLEKPYRLTDLSQALEKAMGRRVSEATTDRTPG